MLQRPTHIAVLDSPLPPGNVYAVLHQPLPVQLAQACADTAYGRATDAADELAQAMAIGGAHERSPGLITEAFPTALRTRLEALGFSFHMLADSPGNRAAAPEHVGKHWYCWRGPENKWDVESGESKDTDLEALVDAVDALIEFARECASSVEQMEAQGDVLRRIRDARDYCAEHGEYRPGEGPTVDQAFDDWAADLAGSVIGERA